MIPISIVLPVRNGAAYLRETLDSILSQTYPHYTLLVLENASTDATLDILKSVSDERIQIFPASRPLSIEENWQRIVDLPLAAWMTIISHDDRWHPDFLSEIVTLVESEPEASLYTTHFNLIDADGQFIRPAQSTPFRETGDAFLQRRHQWHADSFGTGYVMCSEDYRAVGGIPPYTGLYYADDVLWAMLANRQGKLCSPRTLFDYRYYRSSSARTIDLLGLYSASASYLRYVQTRPYFQDAALWEEATDYVERHISRNYQRFLFNLVVQKDPKQLTEYAQIKTVLQEHTKQDGLFAVYNRTLSVIEAVQILPTRHARLWALRLMEETAKVIRRVTD